MAKGWIKQSIKPSHKGLFRGKAERAGMSTEAYAHKEEHASGTLGKEAREALTLMGLKKKSKPNGPQSSGRTWLD